MIPRLLILILAIWLLLVLIGELVPPADGAGTVSRVGRASWYGLSREAYEPLPWLFEVNADGTRFAPWAMHVATPLWPGTSVPIYPLGSWITVTTAQWDGVGVWVRSLRLKVRDTCPGCIGRAPWVDLTPAAFRYLAGSLRPGIIAVVVTQ